MQKHKTSVLPLSLLVVATIAISFVMFNSMNLDGDLGVGGDVTVAASKYYSSLDGRPVKTKNDSLPQVIGIMIDNHPDARPQIGLSKAKIVYEAPVEGGITRYMAIYENAQSVNQVGPVRSARPYFLDWIQEYGNGLYMHSGGSPAALNLINSRKINDANEFRWGSFFWRDSSRNAPHNLFTKSQSWQDLVKEKKLSSGFTSNNIWKFARLVGKGPAKPANKGVTIYFDDNYVVSWKYDTKKLNYVRYVNGERDLDGGSKEIRARNILVQSVSSKVLDNEGRREITTVGKGNAKVLGKGKLTSGTWEKKNLTSRTRFYGANKLGSVLLPGVTWVEIVPKDIKIETIN